MDKPIPKLPNNFKLNPADIIHIRVSYSRYTQQQIADIYAVHRSTISRILNKKIWKEWIDFYGV